MKNELAALLGDEDFRNIDEKFGRFNLFEAIGAVKGELKHSNFLGHLMSPQASHGLGALPLQMILHCFLREYRNEGRPIGELDLILADLDDSIVYRELDNIDILVEHRPLKLLVAVENKIWAKEGKDQLRNYRGKIEAKYPGWDHRLIFLTPEGEEPSDSFWKKCDYSVIADTIGKLASRIEATASESIILILRQYVEMLRRHIVDDMELNELAAKVYARHKAAFDFVFKLMPNSPFGLLEVIEPKLRENPEWEIDRQYSTKLLFAPKSWLKFPVLNNCDKQIWTKTGRSLVFEVKSEFTESQNYSYRVRLSILLGSAPESTRQYFFDAASKDPKLFQGRSGSLSDKQTALYATELMKNEDAKNLSDEERVEKISNSWMDFVQTKLPALAARIEELAQKFPTSSLA